MKRIQSLKAMIILLLQIVPSYSWGAHPELSWHVGGWKDNGRLSLEFSQSQVFKNIDFDKKRLGIGTEQAFSFLDGDSESGRSSAHLFRCAIKAEWKRIHPRGISPVLRFGLGLGTAGWELKSSDGEEDMFFYGLFFDIPFSPALVGNFGKIRIEVELWGGVELFFHTGVSNNHERVMPGAIPDWPIIPIPRMDPRLAATYNLGAGWSAGLSFISPFRFPAWNCHALSLVLAKDF